MILCFNVIFSFPYLILFRSAIDTLVHHAFCVPSIKTVLARQSDENRQAKVNEEQVRLKEAAQSVTSLIVNVKKEATQAQNAIADLDKARSRASKDPLSQISNFRDLNIVKQSAFTGSLLFFIRAISEVPAAL